MATPTACGSSPRGQESNTGHSINNIEFPTIRPPGNSLLATNLTDKQYSFIFYFYFLFIYLFYLFIYLFIFAFLGLYLWHAEIPRLRVESELQLLAYTTAHSSPGSLIHWARPGIKPASSWIPVGFISTEPRQQLYDKQYSIPAKPVCLLTTCGLWWLFVAPAIGFI